MSDLLAGRGVVVTGAGRGLGRAFALAIGREGAGVVVNDVDTDEARAVAAEIDRDGGRAVVSAGSVASWADAEAMIDSCIDAFGAIDGLVNNAVAYTYYGPPWDEGEEQIRTATDVAVLGTLFCGVHAMRRMRERGRGSIVNISSRAHMGTRGMSTYVAVKGAVASATYGWALELADSGVRVNALAPGAYTRAHDLAVAAGIYTDTHRAIGAPPEVVAPAVVYLLSDLSAHLTGQTLAMLSGKLGLIAPPRPLEHTVERERWTAQEIAEVLDSEFTDQFQPVGFEASEYQFPAPVTRA
ncbi:MAG TPA: SDR family oxidoreductase [Solirubrobacteraceae bacterium]|nr:SDR family oxidoreductase [Solirubrobacteraceae bacterium]